MGFDVVVSDVDTVWLQNPLPYLANYPEADILVSSDSLVSPVFSCSIYSSIALLSCALPCYTSVLKV